MSADEWKAWKRCARQSNSQCVGQDRLLFLTDSELKNLHGSTEKHVRIEARTEDAHGGALLALPPDLEKNRQRIHGTAPRSGGKVNPQYTA